MSFTGVDIAADVRDIAYDVQHWQWTWSHAGRTTLDTASLLPVVGTVKNFSSVNKLVNKSTATGYKYWNKTIEYRKVKVYQRDDIINPKLVDDVGRTNLQRMQQGIAPIGPDNKSVNLHHITQTNEGPIAEIAETFHQQNSMVININPNTIPSGIERNQFNTWKRNYWKNRANDFK